MPKYLLPVLTVLLLATPHAHADFLDENPDCAFFEYTDLGGAFWTSMVKQKVPYSYGLNDWWNDRASSVWVRKGFVFEAYADTGFQGQRLSLSSDDDYAFPLADGAYVNFYEYNFSSNLSSFRCRLAGETMATDEGELQWVEGQRYHWRSAGNHPHHKWLEMQRSNGDYLVILHSDHTYGINQEDYIINLTQKHIEVKIMANGFAKADLSFDFWMSTFQDQFGIYFQKISDHIATIAAGYDYQRAGSIEPPKPELLSLVEYMKLFTHENRIKEE
ncbi:MAG: hypothetical protein ACOH5I_12290 [Oligoflexus sp.]